MTNNYFHQNDNNYTNNHNTHILNQANQKPKRSKFPDVGFDDSAKQMKIDISNNSFQGSTMMLDEPIMTRNQCSEMLNQNTQLVLEYIENIHSSFYETENNEYLKDLYPYPNYMKIKQKDINDKMRVILFDWLIDVHLKWKLLHETLFITFNIIDRYLGVKPTQRDELQCVGVGALLLACKYEEIYFPEISDFQEITDNAFSKQEILKKESDILFCLKYDITVPSALRFFEIFNVYLKLEGREKYSALYLIELCIFDYSMLKFKPSLIATGCMMLVISHNKKLKDILSYICLYNNDQIANFCLELMNIYKKPDHGSKSITRKYSLPKFYEVGKVNIIAELAEKHNKNIN